MSSSVHVENKGKNILILGERPTQGLDDMTLTAEAKYPIVKTYSVNSLYLIFRYLNGYFEEINGNEYLTLVPTNESKKKN